jgi:hypothetical protein
VTADLDPDFVPIAKRIRESVGVDCDDGRKSASKNPKPGLEHDPEKWEPVFRKDHAQTKRSDHDPIECNRIMI